MNSAGSPSKEGSEARVQRWRSALTHLSEALKILDKSDGPTHVRAQLDQTIHRLSEAIDTAAAEEHS